MNRFSKRLCTSIMLPLLLSVLTGTGELRAQTIVTSNDFDPATVMAAESPAELLRGQVSGVLVGAYSGNPNEALSVSVRGINSLRGDNQPLWIIDGAVLGNMPVCSGDTFSYLETLDPLAFINPYDICDIEVMKDASATALYGARGANGVIIVRTIQSKGGDYESRLRWRSNMIWDGRLAHNHYLSTTGERNRFSYNISGTYRNTGGVLGRNGSDRAGLKLNFGSRSSSAFQFGMNSLFCLEKSSNPAATAAFGNCSMTMAMRNPALSGGFSGGFTGKLTEEDWLADHDDDSKEYRSISSAYVLLNFAKVLSWKTSVGADFRNSNRYIWDGERTPKGSAMNGAASIINHTLFCYNVISTLTYSQFVAVHHRLSAAFGSEIFGNSNVSNTMNGTDFFSKALRAQGLSLMKSDVTLHKFSRSEFRWGTFVTLGYNYKDIVGAEADVRADFSPKYDNAPQWFPSGKLWWSIIPQLKIEGGYGIAGRELYVPYELTGNYLTGTWPEVDADTAVWYDGLNRVRSEEYHAGLEVNLFKDRFSTGLKFYDRRSTDNYSIFSFCERPGKYLRKGPRQLQYSREAQVRNLGVELDIAAVPVRTGNVTWTISLNGTYNLNKVLSAIDDDSFGPDLGNGLIASGHIAGYSASTILGYELTKDNELKDIDGDGRITRDDMIVIGNSQPLWHTALRTNVRWKGLTLGMTLKAVGGNELVNLNTLAANGEKELHRGYVEKGDYLRLSSLSLKYDIPLRAKWIKGLSVSISGLNLLTLTRYSGYDPEVDSYGTSALSRGFDYGSCPRRPSAAIGLSANF